MELTSRLGEYGSVGAGGADCATESEMSASRTNGRQAISSFLIGVFDPEFMFDLIQDKTLSGGNMVALKAEHGGPLLCPQFQSPSGLRLFPAGRNRWFALAGSR